MKTCSAKNCSNPVFSNLFCRAHQWMRTDQKYQNYKDLKKAGKIPIKRRSDKRAKDERHYMHQAKEFFDDAVKEGTNICIFCGEKVVSFQGLHHWKGRTNDYLLDKEWWSIVHNEHHLMFHSMTIEKMEAQPWHSGFLVRLLKFSEEIFNKYTGKKEKTHKLNPTLFDDLD
jgi:hypothetical protein